jgi:long-chain acyl-CoA synthetase
VISLVEGQLGVTIPEETITKTTTVADLRKLVSQGSQAGLPERRPHWPYWRWVRVIGNGLRETLLHGLLRIWVSIKVEGRENLSGLSSPAIFIFNHVDNFDGPVIYQALPLGIRGRLTVAAADDVLRRHKVLTFITRLCFAGFNLARSEPYMPSLEYVSRMIDQGWHVAIAPEGRISPSGRLQPFKSGIGLLAVNLGVPIIPVKTIGLKGTVPLHANWPKKHSRVTVRIGQPISFGPHLDYDAVTKALHRLMDEL